MNFDRQLASLVFLSIILVATFAVDKQAGAESSPYDLMMSGLVDHSHNFTYSELQRFPMVSEVALMQCIGGWTQLRNWTGIPLFFLLSMTGLKATATEVVFHASDGFSSSLTIERALHPTTLLALQADGTVLSDSDGYPYRLVVPCKYGYKWVKWMTKIEVVDYDYRGTYESFGLSDEADRPNCTFPLTTPPFETVCIILEPITHNIITLSNSTIDSFDFDASQKQIGFNVTGTPSTTGYCYITIPKVLLRCDKQEQWQVWVDNTLIKDKIIIESTYHTYIYFVYGHTGRSVKIIGTRAGQIPGDLTRDGIVDIFDGVIIGVAFGTKPNDQKWNPDADLTGDNSIDIMDILLWAVHFGETL